MVTSKRFLLSLGVATILTGPSWAQIPDTVRLNSGLVSGVSGDAPDMRVFKGIPYAAPPVGPLRWRPPQPVQQWEGVRKADQFGPECMQPRAPASGNRPRPTAAQPSMDEDCLSLNVWTAAASASERRPVIVWSHGGALTIGDVSRTDGETLARKGAVVITCNYRIGPFGFFAHPELTDESGRKASGNYGLMDLFAVLRWVQQNITAFGGDPNRVTLMGQSAGGRLIRAAVASSQGKGLFQRAISQSAPVRIERMLTRTEAEKAGQEEASKVGASSLAELRAKSADEILRLMTPGGRLVIDGWYVTEDASVTIAEGRHNRVDLLIGSNKDEGTFVSLYPTSPFFGLGNASAREFAESARNRFGSKASAFLELYPAGSDEQAKESQLAEIRDEAAWNARDWASAQARVGGHTYLYYFVQEPPVSPGQANRRATHGAEIPYAFNNPGQAWTEVDRALADAMSSYWVNFAKNGDPNGPALPVWPAIQTAAPEQVMILGPKIEVGRMLDSRRVTLFDFVAIRRSVQPASGK
jgi:para-nitrobenzyl esterase